MVYLSCLTFDLTLLESRTPQKTEDELKKFSLDPDLGPIERTVKLLQGNDVQKSVACLNLGHLSGMSDAELDQVVVALKAAQIASSENRQVVYDMSEGITKLLQGLSKTRVTKLASLIFAGIDSPRGQYWGKVLSVFIEMIPYQEIKRVIPEILSRSSMSTSEAGRTAIALTLGQLMISLQGKSEQSEVLQLTKELSNDVCLDVRQASSSQMDLIVRSLDKQNVQGIVLLLPLNIIPYQGSANRKFRYEFVFRKKFISYNRTLQ